MIRKTQRAIRCPTCYGTKVELIVNAEWAWVNCPKCQKQLGHQTHKECKAFYPEEWVEHEKHVALVEANTEKLKAQLTKQQTQSGQTDSSQIF